MFQGSVLFEMFYQCVLFISVFRSRCFTARERLLYWMTVAVLLCLSSFSTVTLGISIPDVTKEPSPILPPSVSDDFDQILRDHDQTSPLDQLPNKSSKIDNISHGIPTESSHGSDHIVRRNNDELGRVRRNHETPERNFERCGTTRDDKTIDENSDVESDEEPETLERNFDTDGLTREGKTNENNDGVDNGNETDERNHEKRKTVERNEDEPETPKRNLETGGKTRGGKTNEYDDGWNEFNKPVKNSDEKEETLERNYENQIDDPTVDAKTNVKKYDGVQSDDEAIDKTGNEVKTKDSQKANNINKNKLDEHERFGTHVQTQIGEPQSKLARQKTILNNLKQEIENYKSHVTHNFDDNNNNNKSEDDAEYIEAFKNSPMSKSKEIKEVLEELDTKNKVEGTNGNSEVEADIKIKDHVIVNKGVTFVTNEDDSEADGKKPETFVKKDSYGTKDNGHVSKPRGLVKDSSVDHKPEGADKDNSIVHKPEESHKDNGLVHKPEESDKDNGDGNKLQTPVKDNSNGQVKAKSYLHVKDDSNVDKLHSPVKDRVKESIQELTPEDKRAKLKLTLSKVETDHKNLKKRFKNYIYNPPDLDVDQERRKLVKRKLKALKSERSAFELSAIHNYHEESRNSATSSTSFKTIDPVALMTDKIGTRRGGRVKGDEARKMIARMEINPLTGVGHSESAPLSGLASVDSSHAPFVWSSVPDHYTYLGLISTPEKFLATSYDRQLLSQYNKEVMDAVNKDLYGGEIGQLKNLEDMKRIRQHTSDNELERGDTNSGTRARRG